MKKREWKKWLQSSVGKGNSICKDHMAERSTLLDEINDGSKARAMILKVGSENP